MSQYRTVSTDGRRRRKGEAEERVRDMANDRISRPRGPSFCVLQCEKTRQKYGEVGPRGPFSATMASNSVGRSVLILFSSYFFSSLFSRAPDRSGSAAIPRVIKHCIIKKSFRSSESFRKRSRKLRNRPGSLLEREREILWVSLSTRTSRWEFDVIANEKWRRRDTSWLNISGGRYAIVSHSMAINHAFLSWRAIMSALNCIPNDG